MTLEMGVLLALVLAVGGLASQWGSVVTQIKSLKEQLQVKADHKDLENTRANLVERLGEKATREAVAHVEQTLRDFKATMVNSLDQVRLVVEKLAQKLDEKAERDSKRDRQNEENR